MSNSDLDLRGYEIEELFKDTIWATYVDEDADADSDGFVKRGDLVIPANQNRNFYRIAKVLKAGPDCSVSVVPGSYLLIPPQVGLVGIKHKNHRTFFVRESLVMAVVSKSESDETIAGS